MTRLRTHNNRRRKKLYPTVCSPNRIQAIMDRVYESALRGPSIPIFYADELRFFGDGGEEALLKFFGRPTTDEDQMMHHKSVIDHISRGFIEEDLQR